MSRGNWGKLTKAGLVLAAVAVFAVAGFVGFEGARLQRFYQDQAAEESKIYGEGASERWREECLPLSGEQHARCTRQINQADRENEREERDLEAQRVTAIWTSYMGSAALIGMAASLVGVLLVFFTFRETRQAAEAARKTHQAFIDVERAVLIPTVGAGTDGKPGPDNMALFMLRVSNIGRSSATVIGVHYSVLTETRPKEFGSYTEIDSLVTQGGAKEFPDTIAVPRDFDVRPFIGGYIEYRSAFGLTHKAYFCARPIPDEEDPRNPRPRLYGIKQIRRGEQWPRDT